MSLQMPCAGYDGMKRLLSGNWLKKPIPAAGYGFALRRLSTSALLVLLFSPGVAAGKLLSTEFTCMLYEFRNRG